MKTNSIPELKVVSLFETNEQYFADKPEVIVNLFRDIISQSTWFDLEKECLVVVLLNAKWQVKGWNLISIGLQNQTLIHSRECYRAAIIGAAAYIVLIHNHPSGDPSPSADDIRITRQMRNAGDILGIPLIDHVIVGRANQLCPKGYVSLKEQGIFS